VLTEVTNARAKVGSVQLSAADANDPAKLAQFQAAQGELSGALSRLLVVSENYPQLKANESFQELQAQLEGTENRITVARNRYIDAVKEFNVTVREFPTNITANMFDFDVKPNFSVQNEAEISKAPTVTFDTSTPSQQQAPVEGAPSRGQLVPRFLTGATSPKEFLDDLRGAAPRYSGFNLLVGGARALYYSSNRGPNAPAALAPGVYGLSNHLLDTPWPKLARTRKRFEELLSGADVAPEDLFTMLADREPALDDHLPSTGLPPDWERVVSAPFIVNERYGTRCSSVLFVERNGRTVLQERRFDAAGVQSGTSRFEFKSVEVPEVWLEANDPAAVATDPSFDSSPE